MPQPQRGREKLVVVDGGKRDTEAVKKEERVGTEGAHILQHDRRAQTFKIAQLAAVLQLFAVALCGRAHDAGDN
jgi:hypothetical protein